MNHYSDRDKCLFCFGYIKSWLKHELKTVTVEKQPGDADAHLYLEARAIDMVIRIRFSKSGTVGYHIYRTMPNCRVDHIAQGMHYVFGWSWETHDCMEVCEKIEGTLNEEIPSFYRGRAKV